MNPLHITITGSDSHGRELATGIVNQAFSDHGFNNIAVLNPVGEPCVTPDVPTLMDIVRQHRPKLFAEPMTIQGSFEGTLEEYSAQSLGDVFDRSLCDALTDNVSVVLTVDQYRELQNEDVDLIVSLEKLEDI